MDKHFINAHFISKRQINVLFYIPGSNLSDSKFYLKDYEGNKILLTKNIYVDNSVAKIELISNEDLFLGKDYKLYCDNEFTYLDYENFINSEEFNNSYYYDKSDLGANYSTKETTFKFYCPLACRAYVKLEKNNNTFYLLEMKKAGNGVFALTANGDHLNKKYCYEFIINGEKCSSKDLYGRGMAVNSSYSAVVDFESVKKYKTIKPNRELDGLKDQVIYEVDIRDFTEQDTTRPTFGAFIKKIPYLKSLGVSHVQLLPVLDFDNVDDLLLDTYNWGYDPINFFSLDGSYSEYPEDPSSRLYEFKTLVNELHNAGIRVILDVVYNHVFEYETSDFEKSFPNFYFRKKDGKIVAASGCGNDFASEKKMARKLIVESTKYLVETFDIDGFRFDLLGLIDLDTTKEIIKECKNLKEDILLYGEGWNMDTLLPSDKRTSMINAREVPEMGFFNDAFRDLLKGNNFEADKVGYLGNNLEHRKDVENMLLGSFCNQNFVSSSQSINYVECHDNQTLFDRISNFYDKEDALRRVKFGNALTILSLGRAFIHMGQEIGLSKFGLDNTYNIMNINNMNWNLVEERKGMVDYVKALISFRNKYDIFNLTDKEEIANTFSLFQHDNGLLTIRVINEKYLYGHKDIIVVINPTNSEASIDLGDYYKMIFTSHGLNKEGVIVKNLYAARGTLRILIKD